MLTRTQIKWLGVIGSLASIVGLALYFWPNEPKPQVSVPGAGSVGMAGMSVSGPITVTVQQTLPGSQVVVMMSHDQFWEAIARADNKMIERLAQEGMKLKPEYLQPYFNKYFTQETFEALQKYSALPATGCPTDLRSLSFYTSLVEMPAKIQAVRGVCGTPSVIGVLEKLKSQTSCQIETALESQRTFESRFTACVKDMRKTSSKTWYERASRFNILGATTYTLDQAIMARLNVALLGNQVSDNTMESFLIQTIEEQCRHYNMPSVPEERDLRIVNESLVVLKGN